MKILKRSSILLTSLVIAFALSCGAAFANQETIYGNAWFTGSDIESDFSSEEIADAVTNMQPGDDLYVEITYRNDSKKKTDWYMANEVLQTLEKADSARKVPEGTGTPENGGYTYTLIHKNNKGKEKVLFSNEEVGGEAKPANMEGLEQATNALDDWFYIQRISKGQKGTLSLHIKFDGETEVNDYMDTDGGVMFKFAVDIPKEGTPGDGDKPDYQQTKTGDSFPLWPFLLMMLAGLALLLLLLSKKKKEEGGDA